MTKVPFVPFPWENGTPEAAGGSFRQFGILMSPRRYEHGLFGILQVGHDGVAEHLIALVRKTRKYGVVHEITDVQACAIVVERSISIN